MLLAAKEPDSDCRNKVATIKNDIAIEPQPITPTLALDSLFPNNPLIRKPTKGTKGINHAYCIITPGNYLSESPQK